MIGSLSSVANSSFNTQYVQGSFSSIMNTHCSMNGGYSYIMFHMKLGGVQYFLLIKMPASIQT